MGFGIVAVVDAWGRSILGMRSDFGSSLVVDVVAVVAVVTGALEDIPGTVFGIVGVVAAASVHEADIRGAAAVAGGYLGRRGGPGDVDGAVVSEEEEDRRMMLRQRWMAK